MKTVLILNWGSYNPNQKEPDFKNIKYKKSYEFLYSYAEKKGVKFVKAHYLSFESKSFKWGWEFNLENKRWNKIFNIVPDLILDKARNSDESLNYKKKISRKFKLINDLELNLILNNKEKQTKLFSKFMPKTFLPKNLEEIKKIKSQLTGKVVVKPIRGSGGEGIEIIPVQKLNRTGKIVQEFIETSGGIKGVKRHDLRLIIINGEIVIPIVRHSEGLFCNVNKGAKIKFLDVKEIPKEIIEMSSKIDKRFSKFVPRFYSIDFFVSSTGKAYLIELNLSPGFFFYQNNSNVRKIFFDKLVNALKSG
jgi:glutathione synthase/RimK-type ligase-like ATP-grasp enzyme